MFLLTGDQTQADDINLLYIGTTVSPYNSTHVGDEYFPFRSTLLPQTLEYDEQRDKQV